MAFLSLNTLEESINIGLNMYNIFELMISLFSVNRVAVGLIFVLFNQAYVAGLDKACFDLVCTHIEPQAWSAGLLFVCLMGEGLFF